MCNMRESCDPAPLYGYTNFNVFYVFKHDSRLAGHSKKGKKLKEKREKSSYEYIMKKMDFLFIAFLF